MYLQWLIILTSDVVLMLDDMLLCLLLGEASIYVT